MGRRILAHVVQAFRPAVTGRTKVLHYTVVAVVATATLVSARGAKWTLAHLADGQPDFQGYWTNATYTPLERDRELGAKEFFTPAEAEAYAKKREQIENSQSKEDIHYDNVIWQGEKYAKVVSRSRTSLIFDPPDGRIPDLTPAAKALAVARAAEARLHGPSDAAASRSLGERCISWGNEGPPMLGSTYQANLQIVQTRTSFVIRHEIMHGVRIIPVDGTPHVAKNVRMLFGDSRGRWEGDTFVVDTMNYGDRTPFRGPPSTARQDIFTGRELHVTERFTRQDADSILYRFTVDDPGTFVKPWSGEMLIRRMEGPLFEYACHEGNYGLANILSAARVEERVSERATAGGQTAP
jgi:hypothetical protein